MTLYLILVVESESMIVVRYNTEENDSMGELLCAAVSLCGHFMSVISKNQ
jgi:hypothetical protein